MLLGFSFEYPKSITRQLAPRTIYCSGRVLSKYWINDMFGWLTSDWMRAIKCLDEAQMGWKYWQNLSFQTNLIHLTHMLTLTLECYTVTSFGSWSASICISLKKKKHTHTFRTLDQWEMLEYTDKIVSDKREVWTHSQGTPKHNLISGFSPQIMWIKFIFCELCINCLKSLKSSVTRRKKSDI